MKLELQRQLFEKYPGIFRQKDLPMTQTCLCWGLEIGPGWYKLLDELCSKLMLMLELTGIAVEATQVKEKYGRLRFYFTSTCEHADLMSQDELKLAGNILDDLVNQAEIQSGYTCEVCGEWGEINKEGYWLSCRCEKCRAEEEKGTVVNTNKSVFTDDPGCS